MFQDRWYVVILLFCLAGAAFGQMRPNPPIASEARPVTADANIKFLSRVSSQADFDSISRVYQLGSASAVEHAMFVIDRREKDRIYYVNSNKYRFQKDFLLANYLIPRGADVFKPVYVDADRRYVVGNIAWQTAVDKFTWELWEGDLATPDMVKSAHDLINATFFQSVWFKPNSSRQEDASAKLGINRVSQDEISRNQTYMALNTGTAVGRIHIVDKLSAEGTIPDTVEVGDNEIIVLKDLPISLPPVRGIIVAKPSSPLSHINILAKGWKIPNVYIKDADKLFLEYNTRVVDLDAKADSYNLKEASLDDVKSRFKSPDDQVPPVDLNVRTLAPLRLMHAKDSIAYGSKSANLGEIINRHVLGMTIPDGFTVPFYWYKKFMQDNGLDKVIEDLMDDYNFVHNPRIRRQKLEDFRASIQKGKFDPKLRSEIIGRWRTQLGGRPVFVRSSSNSEDLPNFSGAGLYSSVPNVREADKLIEAVKTVWASLWTFQGYEARVRNYVSQSDVYMSAFIQIGVDMDRGGVMITKDPFDDTNKNAVYISAVCGHNTKVTGNDGIPEQILFTPTANSVTVMTLSQQKGALRFDQHGDLMETTDVCAAGPTKRVLSDLQARALARAAANIKQAFGGRKEQDIEWGIIGNRIYVVQSRPYIDKK